MSENTQNKKIAIILFNLGGPSDLDSVKPFLFNLFYDKAIITLPNPFRWMVAKLISTTRNKTAQHIYSYTGNKSPILQNTIKQKIALEENLRKVSNLKFEIFICMRHWHPMSKEVASKVKKYEPDEIVLLPLYPQFSTTTTGSSIKDFISNFGTSTVPIKTIESYPVNKYFIDAHVSLIEESLKKLKNKDNFRILFSAHGLPVKIIEQGDPYQSQIEQTVTSIVSKLGISDLDYKITYQSRVGPMKWLEPNTQDEIKSAGILKKSLVIVPVSFVSEHVETLVELDIEYKEIADEYGIEYIRVQALGTNKLFIDCLSKMVGDSLQYSFLT